MCCSGRWDVGSKAGVTLRSVVNDPTYAYKSIASKCRHTEKYYNHADYHDVDEGQKALVRAYECWRFGEVAGMMCRYMDDPHNTTFPTVA